MLSRLKKWFVNMKLIRILVLYFMLSVILMLGALFGFYRFFHYATLNSSMGLMQTALEKTREDVDAALEDVTSSVLQLAYSQQLYAFTQYMPVQKFEASKVVISMLNSLVEQDSLISSIHIQLKNGQVISSSSAPSIQVYLIYQKIVEEYDLTKAFYTPTLTKSYYEPDTSSTYFACLVPIFSTTGGARSEDRYAGAYVAMCSAGSFGKILSENALTNSAMTIMADDRPIATSGKRLSSLLAEKGVTAYNGSEELGGEVFHLTSLSLKETDWTVVLAYPDSEIRRSLRPIQIWSVALMLAVVVIQTIMGFALRQSIVGPLSGLAEQMRHIGAGRQNKLTQTSENEIGILAGNINEMLDKIEKINTSMLETAQALQTAKLDGMKANIMFLQAQINPHFLYNNLECIRGMASAGHTQAVRQMVSSICTVYRYGVSDKRMETIENELRIINEFFIIIKLRYFDRYQLTIDVDERLYSRPIPKMTLQPIVENAVLHGFAGSRDQGIIRLEGRLTGNGETELTVTDNGTGMEEEEITLLNRRLELSGKQESEEEEGKIGVRNVNRRIKLLMGEHSGITVSANEPKGLKVTLLLGNEGIT